MPELEPSWEDVLADCEATAARAEAMLRDRSRFDAERFAEMTSYDLWQLNLPALPAELMTRARSVHERQLALQGELIAAMGEIAQQIEMTSADSPFRQGSLYLDRTA